MRRPSLCGMLRGVSRSRHMQSEGGYAKFRRGYVIAVMGAFLVTPLGPSRHGDVSGGAFLSGVLAPFFAVRASFREGLFLIPWSVWIPSSHTWASALSTRSLRRDIGDLNRTPPCGH
jgi:hypothetical protein